MKKTLCMLLALLMTLSLVPTFATADELPEITWMITGSGTTSDENNMVLQKIGEAIGAKVNVIQVAPGDEDVKLNALIAANTLPDLFVADLADAQQFINEGMLCPLDEFLSDNGSEILAQVGEKLPKMPANQMDGSIYMIPGASADFMENLNVRVDWLKKLGLEMPTDLDSLYNVLHAFTYDDPDGNGQNDTVGIVLTMAQTNQWENLFGAFGIPYNKPCQLEDGTVTSYFKHPHFLECIQYLRKLYQDGVMDPDFATMPAMTAHEKLWSGACGVYGFRDVGVTNNWYPGRYTFECPEDPSEIFGFAQITGPYGDCGSVAQYPKLTTGMVVASTCKNPDAVVRLINYLFTEEGDNLTYLGVEDVMYRWIDKEAGKYERLNEYVDDAVHRANGGFTYWMNMPEDNAQLRTMNALTQQGQAEQQLHAIDYPYITSTIEAETEYGTLLDQIVKEATAQLIVTKGDVEAEYKEFVTRWENEGGLEYEAEATAAYAAQVK
ncbi:MAG: extracellular solute-binding protein [Eubacteriales bacterium]|nr:extracellular solute-binding protein [Eubacteriales bacterium]